MRYAGYLADKDQKVIAYNLLERLAGHFPNSVLAQRVGARAAEIELMAGLGGR